MTSPLTLTLITDVECPTCKAPKGEKCKTPSGREFKNPHPVRRDAAAVLRAAREAEALQADREKLDLMLPPIDEILGSEDRKARAQSMQDGSICIFIKTKRLTTRRAVEQESVNVEATEGDDEEVDQDSVAVSKELLKSKELKAVGAYDHFTRRWFRTRSVPSPLLKSSAYCFATSALPAMYEYLEQRYEGRKPLVEALVTALPGLKAQAQKDLGPLYDETQYPANDQAVRDLFDFTWQVVEIVTPDKKMRSVSQAIFEKEQAKAEMVWTTAGAQIDQALAIGMEKVVAHLSKQLGNGKDKPKQLRQASITKVMEFLDAFKQRNLSNNQELAKLADMARDLVKGIDVKDVRKDVDLRTRLIEGVAKVTADLDKMIEDKPTRAAVLAVDEEV